MIQKIDELDRSILKILQDDAMIHLKQMAGLLNKSYSTIHGRIGRLKESGAIMKTMVCLDKKHVGIQTIGILYLNLKTYSPEGLAQLKKQLEEIKAVCVCVNTTGTNNIVVVIAAKNTEAFAEIERKICALDNVNRGSSQTLTDFIIPFRGIEL